MANRSGESKDIPHMERKASVGAVAPSVTYATKSPAATNAGRAAFTLAETLKQLGNRVEDRLDIMAESEALREGAIAGAGETLPALRDESTIRGAAFNRSARDAALTSFDLRGRQMLADYEKNHNADPVNFKDKADKYLQGALPQLRAFDPRAAQAFEAQYTLRRDAAMGRIEERHTAIVRDRQLETALRHQLAVQDELGAQAAALFSGRAEDAQATLTQMMGNAAAIVDTVNQAGPDGRPLFTAQQRVAAERDAEQLVSKQIGLAWMNAQPDHLAAFEAWRGGKATFELVDEDGNKTTLNLKEVLGPRGYQLAQESFFEQLRSDLALQNTIDAKRDRDFAKNSDALYGDLQVLAQDGLLTLNIVEASRGQLEPDKYIAAREIAKGGFATVSSDAALSRLMARDAAGEDIRGDLNASKGDITRDDFVRLYDRNTARLDKGIVNPVSAGRDFVGNSLGKLSTELGFAQSVVIPQAEAEYEQRVMQFMADPKNDGRQPTLPEAMEIGRDILSRWRAIDLDTQIATLPKPMMMTPAQKLSSNLSTADVQEIGKKTTDYFLKQYDGDQARLESDDRYIEEMENLKRYFDILQAKEGNGPDRGQ